MLIKFASDVEAKCIQQNPHGVLTQVQPALPAYPQARQPAQQALSSIQMAPQSFSEYPKESISTFSQRYSLNADAVDRLCRLNPQMLQVVMAEFRAPEGATECSGLLISFASSVEKRFQQEERGGIKRVADGFGEMPQYKRQHF